MFKNVGVGLVVSLVASGVVLGAASPALADSPDDGDVSASYWRQGWIADFDLSRVSLSDGRADAVGMRVNGLMPTVPEGITNGAFNIESVNGAPVDAASVYQINMLGEKTGYWIKTRFLNSTHYPSNTDAPAPETWVECTVFKGDPREGGSIPDASPFTCDATRTAREPDIRFTFDVALNRAAEASGGVRTQDSVSLRGGTYRQDLSYSIAGAKTVDSGSRTSFSTVMRDGDTPEYDKQARTEWAYQIYDGENLSLYWVAGLSTNYRGWNKFSADGRCAIYAENPLADGGKLDDHEPVASPFECNAAGSFIHEGSHEQRVGNGHFDAQFTVSKKWDK